ncbi:MULTISPECIES: hypothetical protein [Spirosoma]|uniref:Uncharacterized protein n=1 Tax=Spirosoma sordidisoli TaxID=2502893 RepID=A0A4Q2UKH4_9BACT|nr:MULTISPECIES: hypothetical protein [Spirosoma]RYC69794.1 hypothetical protein EQG79_14460 [Spirosoma sordidisoli]
MSSKADLISITLDEQDEPVLEFTHSETDTTLDQKLLGKLLRQIHRQGIELHLVRHYTDSTERPVWEYQIRALPHDTNR